MARTKAHAQRLAATRRAWRPVDRLVRLIIFRRRLPRDVLALVRILAAEHAASPCQPVPVWARMLRTFHPRLRATIFVRKLMS